MTETLKDIVCAQFEEHAATLSASSSLYDAVARASQVIASAMQTDHRLYACGNGGSACDAMHLVEEFVGQYKNRRPALPAHNLLDPSTITCWANDESYADVFRRQIEAYGKEGDVFVGISTSGNSENVLRALEEAKKRNMHTISFLGKGGGKMNSLADIDILVPSDTTARVQEMHILCVHSILECVDMSLYGV